MGNDLVKVGRMLIISYLVDVLQSKATRVHSQEGLSLLKHGTLAIE